MKVYLMNGDNRKGAANLTVNPETGELHKYEVTNGKSVFLIAYP